MLFIERIIDLTHCCVIFHNLIIHLHEKGAFEDEIGEEKGVDIVTEMYEEDRSQQIVSKTESSRREAAHNGRFARMNESEIRLFFEEMRVNQSCITSYSGNMELRAYLIQQSLQNI